MEGVGEANEIHLMTIMGDTQTGRVVVCNHDDNLHDFDDESFKAGPNGHLGVGQTPDAEASSYRDEGRPQTSGFQGNKFQDTSLHIMIDVSRQDEDDNRSSRH